MISQLKNTVVQIFHRVLKALQLYFQIGDSSFRLFDGSLSISGSIIEKEGRKHSINFVGNVPIPYFVTGQNGFWEFTELLESIGLSLQTHFQCRVPTHFLGRQFMLEVGLFYFSQ